MEVSALRGFETHGEPLEARILHQTPERFSAEETLTNVGVAVHSAPQTFFGIVEVKNGQA